jgi:hypothetical protein
LPSVRHSGQGDTRYRAQLNVRYRPNDVGAELRLVCPVVGWRSGEQT